MRWWGDRMEDQHAVLRGSSMEGQEITLQKGYLTNFPSHSFA